MLAQSWTAQQPCQILILSGCEIAVTDFSFATPDLSDAHPEAAALPYQFMRFGQIERFAGPAETVRCHEDNSRVAEAVAEPGSGRVLVVDGQESLARSLLGDNLARKAIDNGWAGIIVIGAIRDVEIIDELPIGVRALGVIPVKTEKRGQGERRVSLSLEGVTVGPGNWVYADRNGVLIAKEPLQG